MTITNIISKRLRKKGLISLLFTISIIGCNPPPRILITRERPFPLSRILSIAVIPFYGNVTDCAEEAHRRLETTLINKLASLKIHVVPIDMEVARTIPDIINITGVLSREKARQIGRLFDVDAFISGSIAECLYYDPDLGEGSVLLTIKIYDARVGDLLLMISGKKVVETGSKSISQMTGEIINDMLKKLGWK